MTVIQQLTEGHNRRLQDLVREQPFHRSDVNLVHMVVRTLVAQAETAEMLAAMEDVEVSPN